MKLLWQLRALDKKLKVTKLPASGAPTDQEIEKWFFVAFTFLAGEPQKILYLNLDFRSFLPWNSL